MVQALMVMDLKQETVMETANEIRNSKKSGSKKY